MAVAVQITARLVLPSIRRIGLLVKPCNDLLLFRRYLSLFRLLMKGH